MTKDQAREIFKFIKRNKDVGIFVVHCKFGQSRSGAVGLFIKNYDEAASEREGFIRRINVLKGIIRNKKEEKEMKSKEFT